MKLSKRQIFIDLLKTYMMLVRDHRETLLTKPGIGIEEVEATWLKDYDKAN